MAVMYDDLEEKKLGRQAKINEQANGMIESANAQEHEQLDQENRQLDNNDEAALEKDAMSVIQQMDAAHDQNQDPMQIFEQLPEVLQTKVSELLQQRNQQEADADSNPQQQAVTPDQGLEPLARTQQGNANITDTARNIASFQ